MRRVRSWKARADHTSLRGSVEHLQMALDRAEEALEGFPATSPGCIGYATQSMLFCGVDRMKGGASVRLYRHADHQRFRKPYDDTIITVRGSRGDRLAGLVAKGEAESTLKLCLEAGIAQMRAALREHTTPETDDVLRRRALSVASLGCDRGSTDVWTPRIRGALATPWAGASAVPMALGSGSLTLGPSLLKRDEREAQERLTAVRVTVVMRAADGMKAEEANRKGPILEVSISPFHEDLVDPHGLDPLTRMRLIQSLLIEPA